MRSNARFPDRALSGYRRSCGETGRGVRERLSRSTPQAVDGGQRVVSGRLPGVVPCGFIESSVCVGMPCPDTAARRRGNTQARHRKDLDCARSDARRARWKCCLRFAKLTTAQQQPGPSRCCNRASSGSRFRAFGPIGLGIAGGMPVLFQMQTGKVEFLDCPDLVGSGRLGGWRGKFGFLALAAEKRAVRAPSASKTCERRSASGARVRHHGGGDEGFAGRKRQRTARKRHRPG